MANILLTSIGSASAEAIIKNLKGHYLVGTNICDEKLIYASCLVDSYYNVSRSDTESFIDEVIEIVKKENIEYIIPLTDVEIDNFNNHRDLFTNHNVRICFSCYESICKCRNKRLAYSLVENSNICKIAKEISVEKDIDYFPLICKKINGRSSEGQVVINSLEEYRNYSFLCSNKNYIIQEFIKGNIVTVDVLAYKVGCVSIAREELLRSSNGLGLAVKTFKDDKLDIIVEKLVNVFEIEGCVNFEFIKCGDEYYFLECNPRFSGGINFSLLSGFDFVNNHLNYFMNKDIVSNCFLKEQLMIKKYVDIVV